AVLAVAGAWLAGREFGRLPGIVAGLALATCPFLAWLCGVAYVENGMLAMATFSLARLVRTVRARDGSAVRSASASGLWAGFACGFKYTAIPTVALPMLVAWLIARRAQLRAAIAFTISALAAFAPWALRNTINTGNPVFPLARQVFHERPGIWSDDAAARWAEGHRPDPAERSRAEQGRAIVRRIIANPLYGWPLFAMSALGLCVGAYRSRQDRGLERLLAAAVVWTGLVVIIWAATTHLVDRFAIAILPPISLLCAVATIRTHSAR